MWSSRDSRDRRRPASPWPGSSWRCSSPCCWPCCGHQRGVGPAERRRVPRRPAGPGCGRGAENLAGTEPVRDHLAETTPPTPSPSYAEQTQRHLSRPARSTSPGPTGPSWPGTEQRRVGEPIDLDEQRRHRTGVPGPATSTTRGALDRRAGPGDQRRRASRSASSMVAEAYPSLADRLREAAPDLLSFLGLGLALGVAGSWLLARLIKRRTRGLEPAEIAALADQREALLHSIREGVVAVGADGQVTVISDSARELLGLPRGASRAAARRPADLGPRCATSCSTDADVRDAVLMVGGRVVVLNRNRVVHDGRQVGTVATLRDRTELLAMQSELSARARASPTPSGPRPTSSATSCTRSRGCSSSRSTTRPPRVIGALSRRRAEISDAVTARVDDPSVAALLIAKVSLAAERGIDLRLADDSELAAARPRAVRRRRHRAGQPGRQRRRRDGRRRAATQVDVTPRAGRRRPVRGPGRRLRARACRADAGDLPARLAPPSRATPAAAASGWPSCRSCASVAGGSVSVHNADGAVFTARLPGPEELS